MPAGWQATRARILARDPLCYRCQAAPSVQVDHKVRGQGDGDDNLGGICGPCHRAKSAQEGADARNLGRP